MIINRILRKSGHFRYRRNIPFNFNPRFILLLPPIRTVKQALTFYLLISHVFAALPNLKSIALFKFSVNKGKTRVLPLRISKKFLPVYRYCIGIVLLFPSAGCSAWKHQTISRYRKSDLLCFYITTKFGYDLCIHHIG